MHSVALGQHPARAVCRLQSIYNFELVCTADSVYQEEPPLYLLTTPHRRDNVRANVLSRWRDTPAKRLDGNKLSRYRCVWQVTPPPSRPSALYAHGECAHLGGLEAPRVPRYAVRTVRPWLVRVPRTYTVRGALGASRPAPPVPNAGGWYA